MHRIDGPGAAPGNLFREGDPAVGTPATTVTDDWCNAVQEELCNAIAGAGLALNKADNAQLLAAFQQLAMPAGAVQAFAMVTPPAGWLSCSGQVVSRTVYARLFAAIGTAFNTGGEGATSFRVPELRGEFVRGFDGGRGADAGRVFGTPQGGQLESHTHTFGMGTGVGGAFPDQNPLDGNPHQATATTNATGGTETRPRNVALLHCIKT